MYRSILPLFLLAAITLAGCTNHDAQECVSDEECRSPRVCMQGMCGERPSVDVPERLAGLVSPESSNYVAGYGGFPEQGTYGVHIYLFAEPDGSATVFYEEGFLGHGITPDEDLPKIRIDTTWRVDGDWMVVGDVLRCGVDPEDEYERRQCELLRPVISEDAVGARVFVDAGPDIVRQLPPDATPDHEALSGFQSE